MNKNNVFAKIEEVFRNLISNPGWGVRSNDFITYHGNEEMRALFGNHTYLSVTIDATSMEFTWGVHDDDGDTVSCIYALMQNGDEPVGYVLTESYKGRDHDSINYDAYAFSTDFMPMLIQRIIGDIPPMMNWDPIEDDDTECTTCSWEDLGSFIADVLKETIDEGIVLDDDDDEDADIVEMGGDDDE
jgi:hypothetical protein